MRLIIPVILIAALLPLAADEYDGITPSEEWIVAPDPEPETIVAAAPAAPDELPATQPAATQPAERCANPP